MSFAFAFDPALSREEFYHQLAEAARSLTAGEADRVANAANLSALLFSAVPDLNWAGFYFYDGRELVVGPFQGLPACVRIPLGRGVCGTAAQSRRTQRVPDVQAYPGHIACDGATRSELVVPLISPQGLVGVLDLDSPLPDRFDAVDESGIEAVAAVFVSSLDA